MMYVFQICNALFALREGLYGPENYDPAYPNDVYPIEFDEEGGGCPNGIEGRACHGADQNWVWSEKNDKKFGQKLSDAMRDFFHKTHDENSLQFSNPPHHLASWFGKYKKYILFIIRLEINSFRHGFQQC